MDHNEVVMKSPRTLKVLREGRRGASTSATGGLGATHAMCGGALYPTSTIAPADTIPTSQGLTVPADAATARKLRWFNYCRMTQGGEAVDSHDGASKSNLQKLDWQRTKPTTAAAPDLPKPPELLIEQLHRIERMGSGETESTVEETLNRILTRGSALLRLYSDACEAARRGNFAQAVYDDILKPARPVTDFFSLPPEMRTLIYKCILQKTSPTIVYPKLPRYNPRRRPLRD